MSRPIIRYKTLPLDKAPHGHKYQKGKWYKISGELDICERGYHCSKNIIDAMGYVTPGWVAIVEVRGISDIQDDKEAWSEIRILEWYKWTRKDSISLAIFAAELVLPNYEKEYKDKAPRLAIEAAKKVLKNDTAKNRSTAWYAARSAWYADAAGSAAWSAWSAAWSAWSIGSTARYAARSAWYADAIGSAALNKCHDFVIERIENE